MKKLITAILGAMMIAVLVFALGCKKDQDNGSSGGGGGSNGPCTIVRIGLKGFNDTIYNKELSLVDDVWLPELETFYQNTATPHPGVQNQGYKLYYSEYLALQELLNLEEEPEKLTNVSVITFTHSLDHVSVHNSSTNPAGYATNEEYLNALHDTLYNGRVFGKSINAYTIGLVTEEVEGNITEFRTNLSELASSDENVYEIRAIDSVSVALNEVGELIKEATGKDNSNIIMMVFDCSYLQESSKFVITRIIGDFLEILTCDHLHFYTRPTVVTIPVINVTETMAWGGGGEIRTNGHGVIYRKGLCWATYHFPNYFSSHTDEGGGNASFTSVITGLRPNTTYNYRAYAKNPVGTGYGEEMQFTTLEEEEGEIPTVLTTPATDITKTSAVCGGVIVSDGEQEIMEKGVCFSTNSEVALNNAHMICTGSSTYTCTLTGLGQGTTYYIRAYAINRKGISYGEILSFTTLVDTYEIPTVVTLPADYVASTLANAVGLITNDGGLTIQEKGFYYGTSPNLTTESNKILNNTTNYEFVNTLWPLTPNTTYYYKAYAKNAQGTGYGEVVQFTTLPETGNDIEFSVSPTKKVVFSPGNLQYNKGDGTWRFAEHQWDMVGEDNVSVSYEWYTGWLDVFGWGTADDPTCTVDSCDYYGYSVFAEWGDNPISNGSGSRWYTLTSEEWDYVVFERAAANRPSFVMANVHNINGIVLLPDGWDINYTFEHLNEDVFYGNPECISDSDWSDILEMNGAVFLPAAGIRTHLWWKDDEGNYTVPDHDYDMMNEMALYWSKTPAPTEWRDSTIQVRAYAMQMWYMSGLGCTMSVDAGLRCNAVSVRLVKDAH